MKRALLILLSSFISCMTLAQAFKQLEGTVSYVTSANVYVKFASTRVISPGDTLYLYDQNRMVPALKVTGISSMSCICDPISDFKAKEGMKVIFVNQEQHSVKEQKEITPSLISPEIQSISQSDTTITTTIITQRKQSVRGRVSMASYSYLSNTPVDALHRLRYTFSLNARNIGNSKISAESYVIFIHKPGSWTDIKENVFNGLKIYNLAVSYDVSDNFKLTAGRKINPRLSNMGAVDGLQAEYKSGSISTGILAGSRPDFNDYGFNNSLFQYGLYVSHDKAVKDGTIQTTFAFVDQRNTGYVDRRFTYIQHSNSAVRNLFLFGSAEFDLFRIENEVTKNTPKLSNLYFSARYRILKNLSASVSYSARTNIIYYETYKSFLERLLENEMQQGYGTQINYRPVKNISFGANAGYRKRKDDPKAATNAYLYSSFYNLPFLNSVTLSGTFLETSYLTGKVYSLSFNKGLLKNKVDATLAYRYQDYLFNRSEASTIQHTGELGLHWYIMKQLSLSANYEVTFDDTYNYNRIYLQLSKRF